MTNLSSGRATALRQLVEYRFKEPLPILLRRLREEGLGTTAVAHRIEVSYRTAQRWLTEFELDDAALIRKALAAQSTGSGEVGATQ